MSHVQPPPCEPWCVHFQHAALSLLCCPQQPMQSRFLRSLIRFPGHPYRSDVMVAKPPSPSLGRTSQRRSTETGTMSGSTARMATRSQPILSKLGRQPSKQQPLAGRRRTRPQPWSKPSESQPRSIRQRRTQTKPPPSNSPQTQVQRPATCEQSWQPFRSRCSSSYRRRWLP